MIKLSGIKKTFQTDAGEVAALKGVDISIGRGEIYGIIGLSGAGKSTLIRHINMLERPTAGQVIVDGQDLTAMNESELREVRKGIGMIFQHFNLLSSATVYDNIAFPLRLAGVDEKTIAAKVRPLLELVGLKDRADNYPSQLSGGQKQRVGIARALANDPKVLLCDEATSALDPQTTQAILELIQDINRKLGLTVVVITHEMQVILNICQRVAVLHDGVVAEEGSVLDVFTNPRQAITKEMLTGLFNNELPAAYQGSAISAEPVEDGILLVRLTFIGETADEPVIASMIRKFPVEVTLLYGSLGHIQLTQYGRMIIGISGDPAEVENAMEYLRQCDLKEEVIGYVKRHTPASR